MWKIECVIFEHRDTHPSCHPAMTRKEQQHNLSSQLMDCVVFCLNCLCGLFCYRNISYLSFILHKSITHGPWELFVFLCNCPEKREESACCEYMCLRKKKQKQKQKMLEHGKFKQHKNHNVLQNQNKSRNEGKMEENWTFGSFLLKTDESMT